MCFLGKSTMSYAYPWQFSMDTKSNQIFSLFYWLFKHKPIMIMIMTIIYSYIFYTKYKICIYVYKQWVLMLCLNIVATYFLLLIDPLCLNSIPLFLHSIQNQQKFRLCILCILCVFICRICTWNEQITKIPL